MSQEEGQEFEVTDSGAANTIPKQCSSLRKGEHVMLKGKPCKIMEMSTSKTGKHGHAKVHLVGIDIFTEKKYEDICPSTHNMSVPLVKRNDYELVDFDDEGFACLISDKSETREDLKLPDGQIGQQIKTYFEDGETIIVTVQSCIGEEKIVAVKKGNV